MVLAWITETRSDIAGQATEWMCLECIFKIHIKGTWQWYLAILQQLRVYPRNKRLKDKIHLEQKRKEIK